VSVSELVGRSAELTLLTEFVTDLTSGTGHATLIEGEPGIGKSSVARWVAKTAEQRGCRVFWATADELGQTLPLRPLLDGFHSLDSAGTARLDTIRRLLRGEFGNMLEPIAAASEQVLALVTELCDVSATVLVVDDLQWADPATIGVWERLARMVDRMPLLLVGATRPVPLRTELLVVRHLVGERGTIRLDRLPESAVMLLLAELARGKPGDSLLRIASDAAGNPLYLTELMAALTRSQRLEIGGAGVVEVTDGPVPGSLLDAIANRLDFLPRDVREVLQAAALLGAEFSIADLAIVRNCRVADLVRPIDVARAAGVVDDAGEKALFRHPLIRAALYNEIATPVRSAWHRDAARALAHAGAPVHRVAGQLGRAFAGPDTDPLDDLLLNWLVDAASTLVAQAPNTAIDLLRQACLRSPATTTRGAWLAARLAEALYRSGNSSEAERVASHVMLVATDSDLRVDLHWTVAQCRSFAGRTTESLESLSQAMALPGISQRQRARLLVLAARAHRDLGKVTRAGEIARRALATAEEAGDIWALGWSLHVLILVSMMRGDVASTLPLFERALDVVGEESALTDLALLLQINKSVALGDLDRYDEAIHTATRVRQMADHTGSLIRLAQARSALGQLLFAAGRWDAALQEIESLADDVKDPATTCCDHGYSAMIAFHRGDVATARTNLSSAATSAGQIGNRLISSLVLARSLDHEVVDELDEALLVLTACLAGPEELDEMEDLLPEAARLAARTRANDVLVDVTAQVAALSQRSRVPRRLGALAYCRGLLDGDASLLLLAVEQYGDAGRPLLQAKALEAAALNLADQGDRGAARSAFVRAGDLYERLGASWDVARLRAEFRRFGIRRGPRGRHRQVRSGWDSLTPSEVKVADLVAEGLSNRQIADRLVLSTRTVESHVSHILAKLGVRSRVDIARRVAT
jgi:DNA-binding CsgD family transcriptional regulator/tetratricopeptide (TPR) repeat protein